MGQPRFLLVSRLAHPHGVRVGDAVVWRLLGANNRHLGQSEETFRDAASCLAAIARMQQRVDRLRATVGTVDHGQLWRWRLDFESVPVACSTRAFRRQRECQYNLGLFLAGALDAGAAARPLSLPPLPAPQSRRSLV
ncbi:hypothetical protein OG871_13240 [Kitasatospora sp. NBC_00374]|uniref:hypothetical protein n=1 Tax=Kitasatospora sp. NBC_00374 TaxID=2975964 RepID=UPI0032564EF0